MGSFELSIGQRIYYTGDRANHEGYGTVTAIRPADRWGSKSYDVTADDGREWLGLSAAHFSPGPGRRFWLAEEWEADRERLITEMQEQYQRASAARITRALKG